jgi:tagatose-1,6-bisphosphate aldolase
VEAKLANFDIRGAIKLLSSDDSLASFNEDVAEELKKNILHHLANFFSQTLPNQRTFL